MADFSIPEVDFLPASFREAGQNRKVRFWRVILVAVFALLIAPPSVYQHKVRRDVEGRIAALAPQCDLHETRTQRLTELERKLKDLESEADLYAYLRHPWPRTRIVANVLAPLPREITLQQLRIARETAAPEPSGPVSGRDRRRGREEKTDLDKLPPAERGLAQLRERYDTSHTVAFVSGTTTEPVFLHRYLSALGKDPLFVRAELLTMETDKTGEEIKSRFRAKVVLRQGYGQPRGPAPPAAEDPKRESIDGKYAKLP